MKQFVVIAFRNLVAHRMRTLILGGAIMMVTTLAVLMLALIAGIKTRMIENATALSTGHVNVGGFLKISQTSAAPLVSKAAEIRQLIKDTVPEATLVVDRVRAFGKIISDENSIMLPMTGVDFAQERSLLERLSPLEGRLADLENPGHIVLFESHAEKLKTRVGDMVTVSMPTFRNVSNTKDLKVAAILKNLGMISSFTIFIHSVDAREIYGLSENSTGVLQVYLPALDQVAGVEDRLRKALVGAGHILMDKDANPFWMKFERVAGESWSGQRLDVTNWEDETSFLKWILDIFNALTFVLTFVLMVIVVIGLINNLWMAVRERTSEIGTMRAVGLQRRSVLLLFVLESLFLAVASVGAGLLLGSLISVGINLADISVDSEAFVMFLMSNSLWLHLRPQDLVFTFVLLSSFLVLGALIPAYRASRMKPITAINHIN